MPITRSKKEETVAKLQDRISKSKALLLARFHGLSVEKISDLRRKFREAESDYMVAKKTLLKIALKNEGKEVEGDLDGEVGIAAGYGDELAIFKIAGDLAKKEKEGFQIVGGFFEGRFVDAATAKMLSSIPGREALIAQLMSVIQGNTRKLVYVLDQVSKKGQ